MAGVILHFFATYGEKSTPKCADSLNRIFASYNEVFHFFVVYGEIFAGRTPGATELTVSVFAGYKKIDRTNPRAPVASLDTSKGGKARLSVKYP
jgi:hypothetical protein